MMAFYYEGLFEKRVEIYFLPRLPNDGLDDCSIPKRNPKIGRWSEQHERSDEEM